MGKITGFKTGDLVEVMSLEAREKGKSISRGIRGTIVQVTASMYVIEPENLADKKKICVSFADLYTGTARMKKLDYYDCDV